MLKFSAIFWPVAVVIVDIFLYNNLDNTFLCEHLRASFESLEIDLQIQSQAFGSQGAHFLLFSQALENGTRRKVNNLLM